MTAGKTWGAAGASAALLCGGLFLAAPAAVAAPDPTACLQASGAFHTTPATAGVTAESVTALEQAAAADAAAQASYDALAQAAAGPVLAELESVEAARVAALQAGDQAALDAAHARIDELLPVLHRRLDTPEIRAAGAARDAASVAFLKLQKDLGLDQAAVAGLLSGLRDFAVACDGVDGAVPAVAPAPVGAVHGAPACLEASGRLHTALAAAGISAPAATALEEAAAAFAVAEANYDALAQAAAGTLPAELDAAMAERDAALLSGDEAAAAAAQSRVDELSQGLEPLLDTPEVQAAEAVRLEARTTFVRHWTELGIDQAAVAHLLGLLQDFLVACAGVPVTTPVVVPDVPAPAPVPAAPVPAAPVEAGPVAVNPGLNVDSAAAAEPDRAPGDLVTAALVALAVAVAAAAGARFRRGGRTRP